MYKVEKYKYLSETTEDFIHNNIYYLRRTKRGDSEFLTTEQVDREIQISTSKMSAINYYGQELMQNNFTFLDKELYYNYKDFKDMLDNLLGGDKIGKSVD